MAETIIGSPANRDSLALTVYGRKHCHLCENMVAALRELQAQLHFRLEVTDVDSDDDLRSRYGERVPVLVAGDEELCHYQLDLVGLDAYFAKIR
ncbi:MAG: glutaredoxin family protein [Nitrosospira sp.]|nr:glutaredoxin family protein [Nitrosospira sp.]